LLGAGLEAVETDVEALAAWWREAERGRVLAAQMDAQHAAAGRRGDQPARSPALVVLLHAAAPAAAALRGDEERLAAAPRRPPARWRARRAARRGRPGDTSARTLRPGSTSATRSGSGRAGSTAALRSRAGRWPDFRAPTRPAPSPSSSDDSDRRAAGRRRGAARDTARAPPRRPRCDSPRRSAAPRRAPPARAPPCRTRSPAARAGGAARRRADPGASPSAELRGDHVDRLADRLDRVELVVADRDVELLLEGEHDVEEARRVDAELVEDVRGRAGLLERAGLLDVRGEDLHHAFEHFASVHGCSPL